MIEVLSPFAHDWMWHATSVVHLHSSGALQRMQQKLQSLVLKPWSFNKSSLGTACLGWTWSRPLARSLKQSINKCLHRHTFTSEREWNEIQATSFASTFALVPWSPQLNWKKKNLSVKAIWGSSECGWWVLVKCGGNQLNVELKDWLDVGQICGLLK